MAQVTLNPLIDADGELENPTTNGNGVSFQVGEWSGGASLKRAFLKFDLDNTANIPAGATIDSATLRIYDNAQDYSSNNRVLRVFRVRRAWTETGVTWNNWSAGNAWTTAGCGDTTDDREATDIGSNTAPATEVAGFFEIILTAASIQEMISGGSFTNNGFILKMDTETNDMHEYSSRSGANPPQLVVNYTPAATSTGGFFAFS